MDDLTRRRLAREQDAAKAALPDLASGLDAARAAPYDAYQAEVSKLLGFPFENLPLSPSTTFIGMACGMMIAKGYTLEQTLRTARSVANIAPQDPYDVCFADDVCDELSRLAEEYTAAVFDAAARVESTAADAGIQVEAPDRGEFCTAAFESLTTWARMYRMAANELYLALEVVLPLDMDSKEILSRCHRAITFTLQHSYPVLHAYHVGVALPVLL